VIRDKLLRFGARPERPGRSVEASKVATDMRKSSHHNFCRLMAMRNGKKIGIIAPSPKRRKLSHAGVDQQDEPRRSSDPESEENASQLSVSKSSSTALVQGELNVSTRRARDSDLRAIRTGDMSRSSMFKFQVDEMLLAVQPNYVKIMGPVDKALHRLKILIESIEDREPLTVGHFPVLGVVLRADSFT